MNRFTDQERRYYRDEEEIQRNQQLKQSQKKQIEAMSNPEEAEKIGRMRKELSGSRYLTDVPEDFHLFEHATNKHFNK